MKQQGSEGKSAAPDEYMLKVAVNRARRDTAPSRNMVDPPRGVATAGFSRGGGGRERADLYRWTVERERR